MHLALVAGGPVMLARVLLGLPYYFYRSGLVRSSNN